MWKSVEELEELDKRILGKINRFKAKNNIEAMIDEDEYFNEDYTQVERCVCLCLGHKFTHFAFLARFCEKYDTNYDISDFTSGIEPSENFVKNRLL